MNVNVSAKERSICEKHTTSSCLNGKYLANIMDDSVIMYDPIVGMEDESYDETITIPTNFNEKKQPVKHKIYSFHLHFY